MNDLYWITVVGNIAFVLQMTWIVSLVAAFLSLFNWYIEKREGDEDVVSLKWVKRLFACMIISMTINIFVPTTKDMLLIYGVGGTMDYLKSNEASKRIPDKCMKALEIFVDEYIDGSNQEK